MRSPWRGAFTGRLPLARDVAFGGTSASTAGGGGLGGGAFGGGALILLKPNSPVVVFLLQKVISSLVGTNFGNVGIAL